MRYLREKYRDFTFVKKNRQGTMALPSLETTKQHEMAFARCCVEKIANRALSLKYCRTLSYVSECGTVNVQHHHWKTGPEK